MFSTGEVFEGEFREDMINGEGEMKYDKVSKYQGSWVNGMVRYAVLCSVMQCYAGVIYIDYIPCTGKYHESVAVLPRVPQARVAMQQQTSDIASTRCVICLSHSYHSNIP